MDNEQNTRDAASIRDHKKVVADGARTGDEPTSRAPAPFAGAQAGKET
eukprot:CAMPEP_0171500180 /NCGR_PEP_ID=MMETSP0958-20121227/8843_1 /TAXON_ID=87120 /ORGANISM="Aurantiochytrium limacinum, Strain ATCCMYA-1381" /LENGTH=47 /DNA_ID= /DNA_START= /DNA_END= /DNA_ORIENTATION=